MRKKIEGQLETYLKAKEFNDENDFSNLVMRALHSSTYKIKRKDLLL